MYIRLFIALVLNVFPLTVNSLAEDALHDVRIVDGINQLRPPNTRQMIGRRYVWNFQGKHYTVLMTIDLERYNSYSGKERYDIPKLVEEGRKSIGNLTREFQRIFRQNANWSQQNQVDFVLSFVQSLPYTLDDVTTSYDEFRRYAIETLIEGGGDCEDTTILVAAILQGLGESVALIFTPGHIAIGVNGNFTGTAFNHKGKKYYYCETTGTGWTVGTLPASVSPPVEGILPLTPNKVGPAPTPPKVTQPEPIQPKPKPEPIQPKPKTTKPAPEKPEMEKQDASKTDNAAGIVLATFFMLVGFGAPIAYILYRLIVGDRDSDFTNEESEYDDVDPPTMSALDR